MATCPSIEQLSKSWLYKIPMVLLAVFFAISLCDILVGFQAILPILIDEHQYRHLCPTPLPPANNTVTILFGNGTSSNDAACPQQAVRLNGLFIVATSVQNAANLVVGPLIDILGPRILGVTGSALCSVSFVVLAFSDSLTFDMFIPGFCLLAAGEICIVMATVHLPNLFFKLRLFLQGLYMSSQDTSAIVFFGMQKLYRINRQVFSRRNMLLVYIVIPILCFVYSFLLPGQQFVPEEQQQQEKQQVDEGEKKSLIGGSPTPIAQYNEEQYVDPVEPNPEQIDITDSKPVAIVTTREKIKTAIVTWAKDTREELISLRFLVLILWAAVHMTASYFFIGTLRDQLIGVSQNDDIFVNRASDVFNTMLFFVALVACPIVTFIASYAGIIVYFAMIGVLYVAYGILILIPVPTIWYFAFPPFIVGRSALFGAWLTFSYMFFTKATGTVIGVSTFIASMANLSNYLWEYIAVQVLDRQFWWINITMTICSVCTTAIMILFLVRERMAEKKREEAKKQYEALNDSL